MLVITASIDNVALGKIYKKHNTTMLTDSVQLNTIKSSPCPQGGFYLRCDRSRTDSVITPHQAEALM